MKKPEQRIVQAVGIASAAHASGDWDLAAKIEKAMSDAVTQALADGITDPLEQRELMLAARQAVLDEAAEAEVQ